MDVLITEQGISRPDTPMMTWAAQNPTGYRGQFGIPDTPMMTWAAQDPTSSPIGTLSNTPDSAVMKWFAGGDGEPVSATGEAITIADYVRRGLPPVSLRIPESLFPSHSPAQVLVTGLKDSRTPGQERRTITVEDF